MNIPHRKVAFHTLGCKLNFAETSTIARSLDEARFKKVPFSEPADVYIINTCSVTEAADRKCRQAIKKAVSQSPGAYVVVVGCYAQLKPGEITSIPGVDLVLGVNEKFNLGGYLDRVENNSVTEVHTCDDVASMAFEASYSIGDRSRSFLKIQDGCDYPCSYCTIPLARGASRNQSIEKCIAQAKEIAARGTREIVLTGVNIGDFGKSSGETLAGLLKEMVRVDGIERIRVSSIEPNLLTDEIIGLVAADNPLLPHFHIPLQSGCNSTLARMRRRYRRELFSERVEAIRKMIPRAGIGADVIVGFPGETDAEFEETFDFLEKRDLSYLHSFSYSSRQGTPAWDMPGKVSAEVIKKRSLQLQRLSEKKKLGFYRANVGTVHDVLWENPEDNGMTEGFTGNYIRVRTASPGIAPGTITRVALDRIDENGIFSVKENGTA